MRVRVCMCVCVHGRELGEVGERVGPRWLNFLSTGNGEPLNVFEQGGDLT